jgi:hypothetical protein
MFFLETGRPYFTTKQQVQLGLSELCLLNYIQSCPALQQMFMVAKTASCFGIPGHILQELHTTN